MPGTAADENHSSSDDEELDFGMVIEESSNEKTPGDDVESFVDWPEGEDFPIYRGEVVQLFKKGTQWEKGKKCKWSKFDKEPYLRSLYPEPSWWGEHPGERKVVTGAFYSGKTIPKKVDFKWVKFANANFKEVEFADKATFQNATFQGNADFTRAKFQDSATFRGATFEREANFYGAAFAKHMNFRTTFKGRVDFYNAGFEGRADFYGATFEDDFFFHEGWFNNVQFANATFQGTASFFQFEFKGSAGFHDATFQGTAGFDEVGFADKATFQNATFQGTAGFDISDFKGVANFVGVNFEDDVTFGFVSFKAEANFELATFKGPASFVSAQFTDVDVLDERVTHSFVEATFLGGFDCRGANLGDLNMLNTTFNGTFTIDTSSDLSKVRELWSRSFSGKFGYIYSAPSVTLNTLDGKKLDVTLMKDPRYTSDVTSSKYLRGTSGSIETVVSYPTGCGPTVIKSIKAGGQAEATGKIAVGQPITHVNGIDVTRLTMKEIESIAESSTTVIFRVIETVTLDTSDGKTLGVTLMKNPAAKLPSAKAKKNPGVAIKSLDAGGQAEASGKVSVGQVITHVNDTDVTEMTVEEVLSEVKSITESSEKVVFLFAAPTQAGNEEVGQEGPDDDVGSSGKSCCCTSKNDANAQRRKGSMTVVALLKDEDKGERLFNDVICNVSISSHNGQETYTGINTRTNKVVTLPHDGVSAKVVSGETDYKMISIACLIKKEWKSIFDIDPADMARHKDEIEFVIREIMGIRAFSVSSENWTGFMAMMQGLYDNFNTLCRNSGHSKLIDVLARIIYDRKGVDPDKSWTTPRTTFLYMDSIKDGYSKGNPSPGMLTALEQGIKGPFLHPEFFEEMNELNEELGYIAAIMASKARVGLLLQQISLSALFGLSSFMATYIYDLPAFENITGVDDDDDMLYTPVVNQLSDGDDSTVSLLKGMANSQQQFQTENLANQQQLMQLLTALLNATVTGST